MEQVTEKQNKTRYWLVSCITAVALGIAGLTMVLFAFMVAVSQSGQEELQGWVFIAISLALLVFFFLNYICNRIIYAFFYRFAPLPRHYRLISCLMGWAVMILVYLVMCLL